MFKSTWLKSLLVVCVLGFGAVACSDANENSGDPINCPNFRAENGGGQSCGTSSDCSPVPCPCGDGSSVTTTSCYNGVCQGADACENACGSAKYVCMERPGSNNNDNNKDDNNVEQDAGVTPKPDTGGGKPVEKSCKQKTYCGGYFNVQACEVNGCSVASSSCVHTCDKQGPDSSYAITCTSLGSRKNECPNLGVDSESACTTKSSCAWFTSCVNPVECSNLGSESACKGESTCSWR